MTKVIELTKTIFYVGNTWTEREFKCPDCEKEVVLHLPDIHAEEDLGKVRCDCPRMWRLRRVVKYEAIEVDDE